MGRRTFGRQRLAGLTLIIGLALAGAARAEPVLVDAASRGDLVALRAVLAKKPDVNAASADGATALHWAAYRRDVTMAELLLRAGATVDAATREGVTPLGLASEHGDAAMIRRLLEARADPNRRLQTGATALMMAARAGSQEGVEALIAKGADVNARETLRGTTALMWAAANGHVDVIRVLLRRGGEIAARSAAAPRELISTIPKGNAPVEGAIIDGRIVNAGARRALGAGDVRNFAMDGGGLTALIFAARANDLPSVRALVEAGADVNQTSHYHWTALLVATQNRFYQVGAYLLEHGANPNIANTGGWSPLYLAVDNRNIERGDYPVRRPDMDHLAFIQQLLAHGADVNHRLKENTEVRTVFTQQWLNENGATAFLRAAQSSDLAVMKLLLDAGADPTIATTVNVTALQVAAGIGWVEGNTYEWSEQANVEAVRLLLELGLDPNAAADTGRTAMHGAALKGRTAVIRMLVDRGARLDVRDYGMTGTDRSGRLELHTWQPIDYAEGLVRIGTQMAIPRPDAAQLIRTLMTERGLRVPPPGRTIETVCLPPDVCDDRIQP